MSEQNVNTENNNVELTNFLENENFKSCFARSVVVNSSYKQAKPDKIAEKFNGSNVENNHLKREVINLKVLPDSPVRFRKNNRSASIDESRRFSCGSILSRKATMITSRRCEIPVENIYNQNKIETLQWQLKEIEKSREMYKAVMKQVVTFLEKAHVSLENLGTRLNKKNSVPRSKSEHHIVDCSSNSSHSQRSLVEEHLTTWNSTKKQDIHPDEIPPEKLSQEAFRLLRTAQSLLNTQEPNLASSEDLSGSGELSDVEFLAQLAREFPSPSHRKPQMQRTTSFSVCPKLITPENDIKISTAFNRKLSLQLSEVRRNSATSRFSRCDSARGSVAESECYSLPGVMEKMEKDNNPNPLRPLTDCMESRSKNLEKPSTSPATASISSTEDESGFSSMNSFQDVGLPLMNSTGIDEVSARSVLLKSMLHNHPDSYPSYSPKNETALDKTLTASSDSEQKYDLKSKQDHGFENENKEKYNSDVRLWQKSEDVANSSALTQISLNLSVNGPSNKLENSNIIHQRWHSTPDQATTNQSVKVLWV